MRLGVRLSWSQNVDLYQRLGYTMGRVHPYPEGRDTWALLAKVLEGVPAHGLG